MVGDKIINSFFTRQNYALEIEIKILFWLYVVLKKKIIQILLPQNVWYLKGYNNKERTYLANVLNKYTVEMKWIFINQSVYNNTHVKE